MNTKGVTKILLGTAMASALGMSTSSARASDAAQIFAQSSGTAATYDNASGAYPVVTAILSMPGVTINGYSYSQYSGTYLTADSSGEMEIYGFNSGIYAPTVGDALNVTGVYKPFDGIPEVTTNSTYTGSVTVESTGNAAPAGIGTLTSPITTTIPTINTGATPVQGIAAQILQLDNVTITGQTAGETFGTGDLSLTVTDGAHSMTLFYYPHDFSIANQNLFGETIPTGTVDIEGLVDYFSPSDEFIPLQITSVPEPATLSLCGLGGLMLFKLVRRRSV